MSRRLLIVACSATKDPAPGLMPALDRYRGAYYQMIRQVPREELPEIVILSALYGFIAADAPIYWYNSKMTAGIARGLLYIPKTNEQWRALVKGNYDDVMICAGSLYRTVILPQLADLETEKLVIVSGGIGEQRSQLKAWLNQRG